MKECPTSLHISNAGIDTAGAIQLACAIAKEVPTIQSFSVSYNNISYAGAATGSVGVLSWFWVGLSQMSAVALQLISVV